MDSDRDIGNWLIEFYLRQSLDQGTLNSLLEVLPFRCDNPKFQKLILLKKLELEVSRQPVPETALELMERLAEIGAVSDAMRRAYCVAAVDCTLRHVKVGHDAADRNYKFFDAVKRLWRGRIGRMEKNEAEGGLGSELLREWKDMIEAAVWDDNVCDCVLKKFEGVSAVEDVKVYVREERAKMGPSFLELVAETMKTDQVLQKIMGVDGTPSSRADQAASGSRADQDAGDRRAVQVASGNCVDQAASGSCADQVPSGSRADQSAGDRPADQAKSGSRVDVAASGSRVDQAASGSRADVAASGGGANVAANGSRADQAASDRCAGQAAIDRRADQAGSGSRADVAVKGSLADQAASGSRADVAVKGSRADQAASGGRADVASGGSNPRKEMPKPRIKLRDKLVGLRNPRGTLSRGMLSRKSRGVKIVDSEETKGEPSTCRNDSSPHSAEINKAREALKLSLLELRAAVKDPLPEALRVAEAISKEARQDRQHDSAKGNDGRPKVLNVDAAVAVQSSGGNVNNVPKPSLMERNSSARTYEWDDSIDGSKEDIACRVELRIRSPKSINASPLRIYEANNVKRRRPVRRWSLMEEGTLREGVEKYGEGNWKEILNAHQDMFEGRTKVDLKDKWRNMTRYS